MRIGLFVFIYSVHLLLRIIIIASVHIIIVPHYGFKTVILCAGIVFFKLCFNYFLK